MVEHQIDRPSDAEILPHIEDGAAILRELSLAAYSLTAVVERAKAAVSDAEKALDDRKVNLREAKHEGHDGFQKFIDHLKEQLEQETITPSSAVIWWAETIDKPIPEDLLNKLGQVFPDAPVLFPAGGYAGFKLRKATGNVRVQFPNPHSTTGISTLRAYIEVTDEEGATTEADDSGKDHVYIGEEAIVAYLDQEIDELSSSPKIDLNHLLHIYNLRETIETAGIATPEDTDSALNSALFDTIDRLLENQPIDYYTLQNLINIIQQDALIWDGDTQSIDQLLLGIDLIGATDSHIYDFNKGIGIALDYAANGKDSVFFPRDGKAQPTRQERCEQYPRAEITAIDHREKLRSAQQ